MATLSIRTNRGDTDFKVVSANPGAATVDHDYELNLNLGLGARVDETFNALDRMKNWLTSNRSLWEGAQ
jgi:hypothetical protein